MEKYKIELRTNADSKSVYADVAEASRSFPKIFTISVHFDSFPGEKFIVKWFSNSALQCSALEPDLSLSLDDQHFTNSTLSHIAVK